MYTTALIQICSNCRVIDRQKSGITVKRFQTYFEPNERSYLDTILNKLKVWSLQPIGNNRKNSNKLVRTRHNHQIFGIFSTLDTLASK